MDLSNEPSQQNILRKRVRCKGLDYSNPPTLEPRDPHGQLLLELGTS